MALTPEDVVNKRFQTTKFREGYDQDEVDDFLDEVVAELRRLTRENEDLRQRLAVAEQHSSEAAPAAEVEAAPVGGAASTAETPVAVEPTVPATTAGGAEYEAENATNLLQLARRLHEEHVREGIKKRDSLIAEGQATAQRLVAEAESQRSQQLQQLEQQKAILEQNIDELRSFEHDYRTKLKGFIENQLGQLESAGAFAPPTPELASATVDQPVQS